MWRWAPVFALLFALVALVWKLETRQPAPLRVFVVHYYPPIESYSGPASAMCEMLRNLLALNVSVTYFTTWPDERTFDFRFLDRHRIPVHPAKEIEAHLRLSQPLAVFHVLFFATENCTTWPALRGAIDRASPATKLVMLSHDVHYRRYGLHVRDAELSAYATADFLCTISNEDREQIHREAGTPLERIFVCGYSATAEWFNRHNRDFGDRSGIVFLGSQNRLNAMALQWSIRYLQPILVAAEPALTLTVVGRVRLPDTAAPVFPVASVHFTGFVEDLAVVLSRCRLAIAPLTLPLGKTGLFTKNVAVLAAGLPLVATTNGTAGLPNITASASSPQWESLDQPVVTVDSIADSAEGAEQFAAEVLRLYQNGDLWMRMSHQAQAYVKRHFAVEKARLQLTQLLQAIADAPPRTAISESSLPRTAAAQMCGQLNS